MSDAEKRIRVVFFRAASGREPVREWLSGELSRAQCKAVGTDLKAVEYNWPVGMPWVRKLDADLWEVRTVMEGGIARVLFTVDGGLMILLHGFVKKSRKTPGRELATARQRLALLRRG